MSTNPIATSLLVVDDDPMIVQLIRRIVESTDDLDMRIETLTDPTEATQVLSDTVVDVLLTDLEMPQIDGIELLRFAKSRNALTQVLFLTGHSTQDTLLGALEFGATDYLLKPIDRDQLVSAAAGSPVAQTPLATGPRRSLEKTTTASVNELV